METCLLCLEIKKEFITTVDINSKLWAELNVTYILEKYMWHMNHIKTNSWMCTTCWGELYGFHKFYLRIEKAHKIFGLLNRNEDGIEQNASNNKDSKDNEIADVRANRFEEKLCDALSESSKNDLVDLLNEYDVSTEIVESGVIIGELKSSIKNELSEELSPDNSSLIQKRKRGRPPKNGISDGGNIKSINKKTKNSEANKSIEVVKQPKKTKKIVRQDSQSVKENDKPWHDNRAHKNDSDFNNDTDQELLDNTGNKCSTNKICPPKTDHNEKDKFLKENFKITCYLCNIPFETFFNMRKHFDEHHKERGHVKCCNKKFYRRSILVDHVNFHLDPNYFKCNQCGKVMADRRCLELHAEIHENNQKKNHCCDICGKGFAKLGILKKHRMIHLSEEEKRFSCSECDKNFASNYLLSSHYRSVHLKKYAKICDICGKSIRCKDVFERHMLQHEGKTAPSVNCEICGLVLIDKKALKRHKDVIHPTGGQHEYTCSVCSKTSPNLRAHKRHVQYKHVMGYDHKCTICDKAFKRAPTLKEHMASHTGTILYTCPWCPKTFNSNANMHNHRKKSHPKEWEEASRKRYSGNLPPNFKPPIVNDNSDFNMPFDV